MREHAHLPAMVGFVRKHVAQHFRANLPRRSPAVSTKLVDAATAAQRFRKHLPAASGALGQSRARLLRRAVRALQQSWNFQVRSCKPDPLRADIVHVREDRRNGSDLAGRFRFPSDWVKMFDNNLVHAIVGRKKPDSGLAEWRVHLVLTCGHRFLLLDLYYFPALAKMEVISDAASPGMPLTNRSYACAQKEILNVLRPDPAILMLRCIAFTLLNARSRTEHREQACAGHRCSRPRHGRELSRRRSHVPQHLEIYGFRSQS